MLRMEIGALEGALRRARQELGASEAGRREVMRRGVGPLAPAMHASLF